jgi:hypothetical protein
MHDDHPLPDPLGRANLNLDDEQQVIATANALCVTPQELREAVLTAGTDIAVLEEHFRSA